MSASGYTTLYLTALHDLSIFYFCHFKGILTTDMTILCHTFRGVSSLVTIQSFQSLQENKNLSSRKGGACKHVIQHEK